MNTTHSVRLPVPPRQGGQRARAVLGGVLLAAAGLAGARVASGSQQAHIAAPSFEAPLVLNGEPGKGQLSLAEYQGQVVVLDFWASWCGPCRAEAPVLQRLYERYKDAGVVVLGVNTSDDEDAAAPAARKLQLSFPIVVDPGTIARQYGVSGLPTLVVISRTGKIVAVRTGATTEATLEELVRKAMAT